LFRFWVLLLFACEFYLWANIKELARVLREVNYDPWPSGFIGLYPNRLTNWAFALTLTALPLGSATIALTRSLPFRSWQEVEWPQLTFVLTTLIGTCFGIFSTILTQRIRASRRALEVPASIKTVDVSEAQITSR
jgi:hypothetical protein